VIKEDIKNVQSMFYVSINGNDENAGDRERPFKSLNKARDAVRSVNSNMTGDIIVYIREGKYYMETSLEFNELDSGTNGFTVYYRNFPGEVVEVLGGKKITGWIPEGDGIYKSYIGKGRRFNSLFENGKRAVLARMPNTGYYTVKRRVEDNDRIKFSFNAKDFPKTFNYSNATIFTWPGVGEWNWFTETKRIVDIDWEKKEMMLSTPASLRLDTGARYYLQDSKDFLDVSGEFYVDDTEGYLYYIPMKLPIENQEIVAPLMKRVIAFKGSSAENTVKKITIEGITISVSDISAEYEMPPFEDCDNDERTCFREGAVYMENSEYCTLKYCKIKNTGYCGVIMNRYAQNNIVYGNLIDDIGYTGVYLTGWGPGEGNFSGTESSYVNKFNIISNNCIRGCGKLIGHGSGIQLYQSGDNEITYNKITEASRYGISLKGLRYNLFKQSYYGTEVTYENHWDFLHSRNNYIAYNDISKILLDSQDAGGFECWGSGKNNRVVNNRIYDIVTGVHGGAAIGIYLDDCSDYFTVENNIVYNVRGASWTTPALLKGVFNVFRNNILANNAASLEILMQEFGGERFDHVVVENNIYYTPGCSLMYRFLEWSEDMVTSCDRNVVYHPDGDYKVRIEYAKVKKPHDDYTWEEWKQMEGGRFDQNSVIADPMFVDSKNGDFNVREDSPALKLGFKNIDQRSIGLKEDFPWDI
jgi:parallel beta-helix repeat protein